MATFTNIPSKGINQSNTPRVLQLQFGGGYSQRFSDTINALNQTWNLSFNNRPLSEVSTIISFFETHAGVTSFDWTPVGDTTSIKVICKTWNEVYTSHKTRTITAVFERVYES